LLDLVKKKSAKFQEMWLNAGKIQYF